MMLTYNMHTFFKTEENNQRTCKYLFLIKSLLNVFPKACIMNHKFIIGW